MHSPVVPALYRKRSSKVKAIRYEDRIRESICDLLRGWNIGFKKPTKRGILVRIGTTDILVNEGDYIVQDCFGNITVSKATRFEALYEKE